jgi:NAD(P) transhydrogenase subunit beta
MPGHMNVLLAEAGVPYDKIFDLEEINEVRPGRRGAGDRRQRRGEPGRAHRQGQPDLRHADPQRADMAQNVIVIKRGKGTGYSGIENALFYTDNTALVMLYGWYGFHRPLLPHVFPQQRTRPFRARLRRRPGAAGR